MEDYPQYLRRLQKGEKLNPFLDFFGVEILEIKNGRALFRMKIRPQYLQGAGFVQGGVMVALADETIAHAIMTLLKPGEGLMTIELKSDFLAPVKEGELLAEARVFKKGHSVALGDCLVRNKEGRDLLRTSATFMILPPSSSKSER